MGERGAGVRAIRQVRLQELVRRGVRAAVHWICIYLISVLNLENSPHQQLTGELTGENISPVKAGELQFLLEFLFNSYTCKKNPIFKGVCLSLLTKICLWASIRVVKKALAMKINKVCF